MAANQFGNEKAMLSRYSVRLLLTLIIGVIDMHASGPAEYSISPDGFFDVRFAGDTNNYYVLWRGEKVTDLDAPVAVQKGSITNHLRDSQHYIQAAFSFFNVQAISTTTPSDLDGDHIDDYYELERSAFLNPLDKRDALQDHNNDGRSNIEEYLSSNPAVTLRFRNLADLVENGFPVGNRYYHVEGYHTPGDEGGGIFYATNTITGTNFGTRIFSGKAGWSYDRVYAGSVNVRWFGVKGNGKVPEDSRFENILEWIGSKGGNVVLLGNPQDDYFLTGDKFITNSFVTLDWRGATLSGYHRFIFDGDSGINGSYSRALTNVYFRHANLGGELSAEAKYSTRGPSFRWCVDSGAENIVKKGLTGTAFHVHMCKRTYLRNIWNYGGKLIYPGAIGFLIYHSTDTIVENCHVLDGTFLFGIQVKGGRDNIVLNSSCRNLVRDPNVIHFICFWDRGDAPWNHSISSGTYPYETGDWATADDRRATYNTKWINCSATDCPGYAAFIAEEGIGPTYIDCSYKNVGTGFTLLRLPHGKERDATLINPSGEGASAGHGIYVLAMDVSNRIPGVRVVGGNIKTSQKSGLYAEGSVGLRVSTLNVSANGKGGTSASSWSGIAIKHSDFPVLQNCTAHDERDTASQAYGIFIDETTVTSPTVEDCIAYGNWKYQIRSWSVGEYRHNSPGEAHLITENGKSHDAFWRCLVPQGSEIWVEVEVFAEDAGSGNRAVYHKGLRVSNLAGGAVIEENVVELSPPAESDPLWDFGFYTSGPYLRARVQGVEGKTITWTMQARVRLLSGGVAGRE